MTELTKFIKQEAKNNGEKVRTYILSSNSASPHTKLYIFFKDGKIVRSVLWNQSMENLLLPQNQVILNYYNHEETHDLIVFWQRIGKLLNLPTIKE